MTRKFAIIVPHYNDMDRLRLCLDALLAQDLSQGEIVVADNATPGGIDAVVADYPQVRFVTQPKKGAAEARNMGVAVTDAPILMFIDSDCVPDADWVATGLASAAPGKAVGGRVDVFDESPPPRSGAEAFETVFAFDMRSYVETKGFVGSGNLVVMRDDFEKAGPFRAGPSEDWDWSLRAKAAGLQLVYEDRFGAGHPSRQDWPALRHKFRRVTREMHLLNAPHTSAFRLRWALRGLAMPLSAFVHMPRILSSPTLNGWGERWRGCLTLLRIRVYRGAWMLKQAAGLWRDD